MPAVPTRIGDAAIELFTEEGSPQVSISDLTQVAGVPRGTIYNNHASPEALFEEIAGHLADEMNERIWVSARDVSDPAARLAFGLRHFIKRAQDDRKWGRFLLRFAFSSQTLQGTWDGQPALDLTTGIANGRFTAAAEQLPSIVAMITGTCLYGMLLVLDGHKTSRDAGSDAAEFVLRALGIEQAEARQLATQPLPPLRS